MQARDAMTNKSATLERFERVRDRIEGYETTSGLELLATIHWVATRINILASVDADQAVEAVHGCNKRKRGLFRAKHIRLAWDRLRSHGWLLGDSTSSP